MRYAVAALLALSSLVVSALTPYLVKDLNTVVSTDTRSSGPSEFTLLVQEARTVDARQRATRPAH